jgi:uncharacterized protein YkwD
MLPLLLAGVGAIAATKLVHSLLQDSEDSPPVTRKHYAIEQTNPLAESQEQTKRQQIALEHQTQQHAMTQTKAIIQTYLEKAFAERSDLLAKALSQLDICIATNNIEGINALIKMIISVNEQSPLAEINKLLAKNGINQMKPLSNTDLKGIIHEHD